MDLKQAEQVLYKVLKKEWEFDVESEIREDWLVFTANLTAKGIDDGIYESVQINMSDDHARNALASATHFNPVDIVCCLHDYKGESFDLLKYVDEDAGFISSKSYQGRELKALELPGLWNGAMSKWNTLFVEVPLDTFNPVKVVLDLLRPAHQN